MENNDRIQGRNITWHSGKVESSDRETLLAQRPMTLWLTGLSGAGKSTVAFELEKQLIFNRKVAYVLDGDNVRHGLNKDLGFSDRDRHENIRRVAEVARLMNDAGLIVITSFISPFREDREVARAVIGESRFIETYLSTPLAVCEQRDPKGLYKRARKGEVRDFTGVDSPYEEPLEPELSIDTSVMDTAAAVRKIMAYLDAHNCLHAVR